MGMGNLIKYIRYEISHVAPDLSEADAKVKKEIFKIIWWILVSYCIVIFFYFFPGEYADAKVKKYNDKILW